MERPARLVLENVPQVKFYDGGSRCPEDICLPSVLRAITEYTDDPDYGCNKCRAKNPNCQVSCSYAFFVGVTGAAFYISWKDGWHEDNQAHFYLDADAGAMERNAFKAMGYSFEWLMPEQREQFVPRIAASLQRGMPVICHGIIGPPEAGLITGYDDDGETILGWSFFQNFEPGIETEAPGYYRKKDWAKDVQSILIVGEKGPRPPLKETYRAALEFALKVIRTPMVRPEADAPEWYRHRHNGLAAYDAWIAHLLDDKNFPAGDETALRRHFEVHDHMVGMVAEARWYGSQFLVGMTEQTDVHVHRDAIEPLLHAAALYAGDHELMWKLWDLAGGIGNAEGWKLFTDPAVRRQMVPLLQETQRKDRAAAEYLEIALSHWH
ncbi:MAG: hypothetical protein ACOYYS_11475 [Chloroflexota bacterium]